MLCYIYKIISTKSDKIYIGSSTNKYRYSEHTSRYLKGVNNCSVVKLFDLGLETCSFIILESFDFIDFDHQISREQYFIDQFKNNLINLINAKCKLTGHERYLKYKDNKIKYQTENKLKIAEQEKIRALVYIDCSICQKKIKKRNKARHEKSKLHQSNLSVHLLSAT